VYPQQNEVDTDDDRVVGIDGGSRHWIVVAEQIRQQLLLVRRVAKLVRSCNEHADSLKTVTVTYTITMSRIAIATVLRARRIGVSRMLLADRGNCSHCSTAMQCLH